MYLNYAIATKLETRFKDNKLAAFLVELRFNEK